MLPEPSIGELVQAGRRVHSGCCMIQRDAMTTTLEGQRLLGWLARLAPKFVMILLFPWTLGQAHQFGKVFLKPSQRCVV